MSSITNLSIRIPSLGEVTDAALTPLCMAQGILSGSLIAEKIINTAFEKLEYEGSALQKKVTEHTTNLTGATLSMGRRLTIDKSLKAKIHELNKNIVKENLTKLTNDNSLFLKFLPKDERITAVLGIANSILALTPYSPENLITDGLNAMTDKIYDNAADLIAAKISTLTNEPLKPGYQYAGDTIFYFTLKTATQCLISSLTVKAINEVSERTYGEPLSEPIESNLKYAVYGLQGIQIAGWVAGHAYFSYQSYRRVSRMCENVKNGIEKELIEAADSHPKASDIPKGLRDLAIKSVVATIYPKIEELVKEKLKG